jgi:aryl-alcohol dehydrogenase-like predicted oxidoreductase
MEVIELGKSGVNVAQMGVGTMLWTPNKKYTKEMIFETYNACLDNGLNFFDTAEIYGSGKSEMIIGECLKKDGRKIMISTKFAPPSKMNPLTAKRKTVSKNSPKALLEALDGSLQRLGLPYIDLYFMHIPPKKNTIPDYMEVMAEAVKSGKVKAVGVCNFNKEQIVEAHTALAKHNIPLSAVMVGYNLLRRFPETNGVFEVCKNLGISVIPYAPLAEGILTGRYRNKKAKVPFGYKIALYFGHLNITKDHNDNKSLIKRIFSKPVELDKKRLEKLFTVMDGIAKRNNKTLAQVAINWIQTNPEVNIISLVGMKSPTQVANNIGGISWAMTTEDRRLIDNACKELN